MAFSEPAPPQNVLGDSLLLSGSPSERRSGSVARARTLIVRARREVAIYGGTSSLVYVARHREEEEEERCQFR